MVTGMIPRSILLVLLLQLQSAQSMLNWVNSETMSLTQMVDMAFVFSTN